jgi:hypothetical protein
MRFPGLSPELCVSFRRALHLKELKFEAFGITHFFDNYISEHSFANDGNTKFRKRIRFEFEYN